MILRRDENEVESDYYLVEKGNKKAIFHKSGYRIADWYDWISLDGLLKGESDYFIVVQDGKYAIFDKYGGMITRDWYDWVSLNGLVKGKSNYFLAEKDGKYAIFDKDGKMISPKWFDKIYPFGLVEGKSNYFVACEEYCAVYHKNGSIASEFFSDARISGTKYIIFNDLFHFSGVAEFIDKYGNIIDIVTYSEPPDRREEIIDYTKLLNI